MLKFLYIFFIFNQSLTIRVNKATTKYECIAYDENAKSESVSKNFLRPQKLEIE